jgi:hypothetical protein
MDLMFNFKSQNGCHVNDHPGFGDKRTAHNPRPISQEPGCMPFQATAKMITDYQYVCNVLRTPKSPVRSSLSSIGQARPFMYENAVERLHPLSHHPNSSSKAEGTLVESVRRNCQDHSTDALLSFTQSHSAVINLTSSSFAVPHSPSSFTIIHSSFTVLFHSPSSFIHRQIFTVHPLVTQFRDNVGDEIISSTQQMLQTLIYSREPGR